MAFFGGQEKKVSNSGCLEKRLGWFENFVSTSFGTFISFPSTRGWESHWKRRRDSAGDHATHWCRDPGGLPVESARDATMDWRYLRTKNFLLVCWDFQVERTETRDQGHAERAIQIFGSKTQIEEAGGNRPVTVVLGHRMWLPTVTGLSAHYQGCDLCTKWAGQPKTARLLFFSQNYWQNWHFVVCLGFSFGILLDLICSRWWGFVYYQALPSLRAGLVKDPAMTPEEAADAARPKSQLAPFGAKSDVLDIEMPWKSMKCLDVSYFLPFLLQKPCNDLMLPSGCEDLEEGTLRSLSLEVHHLPVHQPSFRPPCQAGTVGFYEHATLRALRCWKGQDLSWCAINFHTHFLNLLLTKFWWNLVPRPERHATVTRLHWTRRLGQRFIGLPC